MIIIDPDNNLPIDMVIIKLETGGLMGVDISFLTSSIEPVYSVFDKGVEVDIKGYERPLNKKEQKIMNYINNH